MPINPNDFLFHSDYLPYPRQGGMLDTVSVAGSINAGATIFFYGSKTMKVGTGKTQSVIRWKVPSSAWVPAINDEMQVGVWKKGQYGVNKQGTQGQQPTGIWCFPFVDVQNGVARAGIKLYNNQTTTLTIPTTTFETGISTYSIPV